MKSWSQALFLGETLEASLERLARHGYDGVELPVTSMLPAEIRARLSAHGLACTSVNGRFIGMDRDLSAPDPERRAQAVGYVKTCLRYAAELGAPVAIVVPTRIGKLSPELTLAEDWAHAADSLAQVARTAEALGVTAVLECVNRAESHLMTRLTTARRMVEQVGSPGLRLMADSFHMNIEEASMTAALEEVAPWLAHVHLADNDRTAPGMGHLDLLSFLRSLRALGYRGALTMECDIQAPDGFGRMAPSTDPAIFDAYVAKAMATIRAHEALLAKEIP